MVLVTSVFKKRRIVFILIFGVMMSACGPAKDNKKEMVEPVEEIALKSKSYEPKIINLTEFERSGQKGVAKIEQKGDETKVSISIEGGKKSVSQPAHVHYGVCPRTGIVKYPLNDVVNGKSETILKVNMGELVASGSMAINVHKSIEEYAIYTSCGDIK